jgi:hypothetical protein
MRALTTEELEFVSGGTEKKAELIIVTAVQLLPKGSGFGSGYGGGPGGGNGFSDSFIEAPREATNELGYSCADLSEMISRSQGIVSLAEYALTLGTAVSAAALLNAWATAVPGGAVAITGTTVVGAAAALTAASVVASGKAFQSMIAAERESMGCPA